ncbi:MAG: glycosyltransferase, partial [Clostridia bacterium]
CLEARKIAKKKSAKIVFYTDNADEHINNRLMVYNQLVSTEDKIIVKLYTRSKCIIVPTMETKKLLQSYGVILPIYVIRLSKFSISDVFVPKVEGKKLLEIFKSLDKQDKEPVTAEKPLNIAIFSDTYPPDVNGVSISVYTLRKALEELGHNVYVVVPTETTKFTGIVWSGGLIRIPGITLKWLYGYRLAKPFCTKAMQILKKSNIDVIHLQTDFSMRFFAESCSKFLKAPVVYTYHTMYEDYTHYLAKGPLNVVAQKLVSPIVRTMNRNCQWIIAPTEKTKASLLKYNLKAPIDIIPTGINLDDFKDVNKRPYIKEDIRTKYNLKDKFCFIYLGRIAEEKSIEVVIECFSKLLVKASDTMLVIAGYGPFLDNLKAKVIDLDIEDNVVFTDKIEHSQVPFYYKLGDVFVSASKSETQGITYIEAMASGLPVIAMKDECISGVVIDNENGCQCNDKDDMIKAMYDYRHLDEKEFSRQSENALLKAEEFSILNFGKKVVDVYANAINDYRKEEK